MAYYLSTGFPFLDDDVDLRVSHPKQGAVVDVGAADNRYLRLKVKAPQRVSLRLMRLWTSSSTTMASTETSVFI